MKREDIILQHDLKIFGIIVDGTDEYTEFYDSGEMVNVSHT